MKQPTINQIEAGGLNLETAMANLSLTDALNYVDTVSYNAPAHTATVRRLAKQYIVARFKAQEDQEKKQQKKTLFLSSLTAQEKQQINDCREEYAIYEKKLCREGVTGKKRRKKLSAKRSALSSKCSVFKVFNAI